MSASNPVHALTVVYARNIERVAEFYRKTLSLELVEQDDAFVVVGSPHYQIAVVRIAADRAPAPVPGPLHLRTATPIKGSFLVENLEHARSAAESCGGGFKPLASAWRWRDQLHLDGHDPEGNVVQVRALVP
ncbi:VOC family protein [Xanthomonas tesorieronis]|uniref:VOC family protein n=1 Tax=Xanthomonas tesorieronis TaxID=3160839 RepID=UPI003518322C